MMIIVGERINTSRKLVGEAVASRNVDFIRNEVKWQIESGVTYLDVNVGTFVNQEMEYSEWLIRQIREVTQVPLCIDSPSPAVLEQGLKLCYSLDGETADVLINSITGEQTRIETVLPLVNEYKCSVVALCLDDTGLPHTIDQRINIADRLIAKLINSGIPENKIYIDPLIIPLGTDHTQGKIVLDTIQKLRAQYDKIHIICGLSNISYGLPERKLLNQTFLVLAMQSGMDAVILDPVDKKIMANLIVTDMVLGNDEYCTNYLTAFRQGRFQ